MFGGNDTQNNEQPEPAAIPEGGNSGSDNAKVAGHDTAEEGAALNGGGGSSDNNNKIDESKSAKGGKKKK